MKILTLLTACTLLACVAPAFAHGPHEHGVARLDVAVDGATVEINLESPLANALPFEHAPQDATQRLSVQNMAARLRQAETIFVFPEAAQCRIKKVTLGSEALPPDLLRATAAQHSEQKQAQKQKAPMTPATDMEQGERGEHAEHADLDAQFTFECANPEALSGMDVRLFSTWTALHVLHVQIVSPSGQHGAELTEQAHTITW